LKELFNKHDRNGDKKLTQLEWINMYFDPKFDGPLSEEQLIDMHTKSAGSDRLLTFRELEYLIAMYGDQM